MHLANLVIGGVGATIAGILVVDQLEKLSENTRAPPNYRYSPVDSKTSTMSDPILVEILGHVIASVNQMNKCLEATSRSLEQLVTLSTATHQSQDRLERAVADQRSAITLMSDLMHVQTTQLANLTVNHVTLPRSAADPHSIGAQESASHPVPPAPRQPAIASPLDKAAALVQTLAQEEAAVKATDEEEVQSEPEAADEEEEVQPEKTDVPPGTLTADQAQHFVQNVTATIQQVTAQWNTTVRTFGDPKGLTDEGRDALKSQLATIKLQLIQSLEAARAHYDMPSDFGDVRVDSDDVLDEYQSRKAMALCQYTDTIPESTQYLTNRFEGYEKLALVKDPTLLDRAPNSLALHQGHFLAVHKFFSSE